MLSRHAAVMRHIPRRASAWSIRARVASNAKPLPAVIRHDTVPDLDRFSTLVYLRAALLAYSAVEMFFADVFLHHYLEPYESIEWIVGLAAAIFTAVAWLWTRRSDEPRAG